MNEIVIAALVVGIICGLIGRALASGKGRGSEGFVLGFLFGPIGIVIALLLSPKAVGHHQGTKHCPYCGKAIDLTSTICPNCHRSQPPRATTADWEKTVAAGDDVEKWGKNQKSDDAS